MTNCGSANGIPIETSAALVQRKVAVWRHLAPNGAVYLFWDARHTQPGRVRDLADRLSEKVRLAKFSVNQVLVKDLRPAPAVCVIGQP